MYVFVRVWACSWVYLCVGMYMFVCICICEVWFLGELVGIFVLCIFIFLVVVIVIVFYGES